MKKKPAKQTRANKGNGKQKTSGRIIRMSASLPEDRLINESSLAQEPLSQRGFDKDYIPTLGYLRRMREGYVRAWQEGIKANRRFGNAKDANYWESELRKQERGFHRDLDDLYLTGLQHIYEKKADWVHSLVLEAQSATPGAMDELLERIRHAVLFQDHPSEKVSFIQRVADAKKHIHKLRAGTMAEDRFRATHFCISKLLKATPPTGKIGRVWLKNNLPSRKEVNDFLEMVGKKRQGDPYGKNDARFYNGPILSNCIKSAPHGNR